MRISDWSSDVCSSDLPPRGGEEFPMETFRIEVGHVHGVQPGNIVGAIANEADLESRYIGRIDIRDDYSLVDLPEGMPRELLEHLKRVYVSGQSLKMRRADDADTGAPPPRGTRPFAGKPRAQPQADRKRAVSGTSVSGRVKTG